MSPFGGLERAAVRDEWLGYAECYEGLTEPNADEGEGSRYVAGLEAGMAEASKVAAAGRVTVALGRYWLGEPWRAFTYAEWAS